MKTLANPQDVAEVRTRLESLTGDEQRQWGVMSVGEMLCHLREAYLAILNGRQLSVVKKNPLPQRVLRYLALRGPKWPPSVPTTRELEVGQPGMVPGNLVQDRAEAVLALQRFVAEVRDSSHPMLGPMRADEWLRWGYLHADHHLRQFGR